MKRINEGYREGESGCTIELAGTWVPDHEWHKTRLESPWVVVSRKKLEQPAALHLLYH